MIAQKIRLGFLFSLLVLMVSPGHSNECARSEAQAAELPQLSKKLTASGGIQALQGIWKFPGVFGIGQTSIVFQSRSDAFYARVDDSEFAPILICDTSMVPGGALELRILDKKTREVVQTVWVRVKNANEVEMAAEKSNWSFYTFSRKDKVSQDSNSRSPERYHLVDASRQLRQTAGVH